VTESFRQSTRSTTLFKRSVPSGLAFLVLLGIARSDDVHVSPTKVLIATVGSWLALGATILFAVAGLIAGSKGDHR
jgi:hypothetical protein